MSGETSLEMLGGPACWRATELDQEDWVRPCSEDCLCDERAEPTV